ncbi:hypothetical protein VNO77_33294 [Canavalia gladiata]|uniref:Uncharacterized protein n=1 Tax=Canavalia gladiata TaxID=3824 RepID=A0AAN9PXK8_CANGL
MGRIIESNQNHFFCEFSFSFNSLESVSEATELPQCICVWVCVLSKKKSRFLSAEKKQYPQHTKESFNPKDKTGDYLRKRRAVEAWKKAIQFRPFGTCIMARKMHCALQEIDNDSPKASESRKDSISTIFQQQTKFTSLEDCQESSLSRINSDSRYVIISCLNDGPDGTWRIVTQPVLWLNHINLVSGVNMDLQLLYPPPVNRLKMIDQCKGPRGPLPPYGYSVKSCTKKGFNGSNVHRRCQNKIANRASKLNELPGNSCSQGSLVCSPGLFPDGSAAVNSSDKYPNHSKEDKSLKKNSRKRARKKVRQSKKKSSDSGSTEREVLTEEYVCVSLASETCSNNDVDKEVGLMYTTAPEFSSSDDRLIRKDCEINKMNDSTVLEESNRCNSYLDEAMMSKATAPAVQSSAGECTTFESKNQLHDRAPDFAVIDREVKDIQCVELCGFNDIQESLVLDSVSVSSRSDESTNADDIGKRSNKASGRIRMDSGDGCLLGQNLVNGSHNNSEHNEEIRHDSQNISNDKRVKQKKTMSKSSSFNKFGGVAVLHGRTGKENSHSVWQKVQKNSSDECVGDLKKVNTTLSQFSSTVDKNPPVIKNCNSVSANGVSKIEDKKHSKNKVGRKSKGKMDAVSKKGQCHYSRKGSINRSLLNDHGKVSVQQNDMSHSSCPEIDQQGLNTVSGFNSDINCLMDGAQTNGVDQITSEIDPSAQIRPDELGPQKSAISNVANMRNENIDIQASSLLMSVENINQSNMSEEQFALSCNHLGDEVGQTEKEESSADYNAQKHSSGSTLWKWIPIGKKGTVLEKSESNILSPEYSDAPPSNNLNLESSVEPKVAPLSENQDSSLNASRGCTDQLCNKVSCLDEGENHKLGSQDESTLTDHRDKHEANCLIDECGNQDMLENDSCRIALAVNDACRAQLACEAVHLVTGGPVAEFERLLHFCSPVICESLDSLSCSTCSHDHAGGGSLCRHEMPDLSLGCLWQWYEKHGSYGLEIRAQDCENLKRQGGAPFHAYFVPSLSAVQLFKNHKNHKCVNSSNKLPNCEVSEACETIDNEISENSSTASQHSIFSTLFPQPRNQDASIQTPKKMASTNGTSNPSINSTQSGDLELLFEYFELEQPQQRWPLYEKIQELVRGNVTIQSTTYGDPTKLDSINLRDLHPRSWYSVAWYPIYRIPDGNFRAAFLTYHSLGHLVHRSTSSDLSTVGSSIVSPAVGLQSYNAQGECWFQLKHSALAAERVGLNPSLLLKERLRTLEETASLMARAVVNKGNIICTNRHHDYEFFLSRRRY